MTDNNVIRFPTVEDRLADALTEEHYEAAEAIFAPLPDHVRDYIDQTYGEPTTIRVVLPDPPRPTIGTVILQLLGGAAIGTALVLLVLA